MAVKISDLLPKKTAIDIAPGVALEVGPINLQGITALITNFREPLTALVSSSTGGRPDFAILVQSAPDMIIAMIAMGADAVGQEDDIAKLPFGVQVTAAAAIWEVSVPDVKKLLNVLSTVLAQLKPLPKSSEPSDSRTAEQGILL